MKLKMYKLYLIEELSSEISSLVDEIKIDRKCSEEKAQEYLVQGLISAKTREAIFMAYLED